MKIVSQGISWKYRVGCPDCKSQLEIDDNDVRVGKELHKSIWDSDWYEDYFYVKCPQCSLRLKIEVPEWVENKARNN